MKEIIDLAGRSSGKEGEEDMEKVKSIRVEIRQQNRQHGGDQISATTLDQVFHTKKVLVHEALSKVSEAKRACQKKLHELQSLQSRVEIGFQPALDQMVLDEERLLADVQRRRMITEKVRGGGGVRGEQGATVTL